MLRESSILVRTKPHLRWIYRRSRHRPLTGSVVIRRRQSRDPKGGSLLCGHVQPEIGISRPFFGCFRICCVVLHVRVLTVISKSYVTLKGVILKGVCTYATGSWAISAQVGHFSPEMTSSNVTPNGFPWVRCAHAQTEVAQYPIKCHP